MTPLEQYPEGVAPICPIPYSPAFSELMSFFRAVFHSREITMRAYNLTEDVIRNNAGNYSAWHYRRLLIDELKIDKETEMKFLNLLAEDLEKNYQIWHHRRCVIEKFQNFEQEKEFLEDMFISDSKNYHAWSYRIWLIERFNLYDGELAFTDSLLDSNVTNNSIWSYRYFITAKTTTFTHDVIKSEVNLLITKRLP